MAQIRLNKPGILGHVEDEIEEFLEEFGAELVLLRVGREGRHRTLTIYVDKPGGVTVDDCQDISEKVSVLLDVLDPFPGSYRLVVSSPGLDRPLTKDEHFQRFQGREAALSIVTDDGTKMKRIGKLAGTTEDAIILESEEGLVEIPKSHITDARLVVRWGD